MGLRHLQLGAQAGDRAAQLVGGVGDEPALSFHGGFERGERLVGGAGEAGDLVTADGLRDPPAQVGGGGDRGHLAADVLDGPQGAAGHQPGDPGHHAQEQGQSREHHDGRRADGGLPSRQGRPGVDEYGLVPRVRGLDLAEPVRGVLAVDGGAALAVPGGRADAAGLGVVRVVVVIAVRAGARRRGDAGDAGAADRLQVLADGEHPAVPVDDLDGVVLGVGQFELRVRSARRDLGGDPARGGVGLRVGLPAEVAAEREEDGDARREQGDGDDQGGAEGRLRPDGAEGAPAAHRASSR